MSFKQNGTRSKAAAVHEPPPSAAKLLPPPRSRCRRRRLVLKEFPHGYAEVVAERVNGSDVDPRRRLVVKESDGVAVQAGVASDIGDLELSLAHQTGEVALDQCVLEENMISRMSKSLDMRRNSSKNDIQNDKKLVHMQVCRSHCLPLHKEHNMADLTYLTTDELSARIKYDVRTIRERLKDSVLLEGVHYIRPFGGRKILFVWDRIAADLAKPVEADHVGIPMSNGGVLHG